MSAQASDAFGIELIKATGARPGIGHETCILQHFQVLGNGGPADGHNARQLVHGERAGGQLLKDGHPGGVAQGIEAGL